MYTWIYKRGYGIHICISMETQNHINARIYCKDHIWAYYLYLLSLLLSLKYSCIYPSHYWTTTYLPCFLFMGRLILVATSNTPSPVNALHSIYLFASIPSSTICSSCLLTIFLESSPLFKSLFNATSIVGTYEQYLYISSNHSILAFSNVLLFLIYNLFNFISASEYENGLHLSNYFYPAVSYKANITLLPSIQQFTT